MAYACAQCGCISAQPRCPAHQTTPIATNGRSATSFNGRRDRATQAAFRTMLIKRDGLRCATCGAPGVPLQAHHTGQNEGRLQCNQCHRDADDHAR